MPSMNWKSFMARWSAELMAGELAERVDLMPRSPDWLGFDPANERNLEDLEGRLGVILPPSYRSFLLTSNGWRRTTFAIGQIRSSAEVDWFRIENESWAEVYSESGSDLPDEEYYMYPEGGARNHRAEHIKSLLQISDVDDGVYLLNPEAVTPNGEWEAWFFANWVPGAIRYPSFAHLMLGEYLSFASMDRARVRPRGLPKLSTPRAKIPRVMAERVRKDEARAATLDRLISQLGELDGKSLDRALRAFFGKLKGRPWADRRPDLVPVLEEMFRSSRHAGIRSACIAALTELADAAPATLLEALSDDDPGVVLHGISALAYFPNPDALEPLCRFIESPVPPIFKENAMSALWEIGDERAVPTLVGVLLDTSTRFDQSFGTAAIALSRCGPKGFKALVSALDHSDPRVRTAAVVGVDCSGDPRATELLDRMLSDSDAGVRERAKIRVGKRFF